MAEQLYEQEKNEFWIDLHKCSVMEAAWILNNRIDECYKYGISCLEVIFGTPDRYEGSIQQAVDEIKKGNVAVALEMAGVIIATAVIIQSGVMGITAALI